MNIFERDLKEDELKEILTESFETTHMIKKHTSMRLYHMAKVQYELNKRKELIQNKMYKGDVKQIKEIHLIGENEAIIETYEKLFGEEEKTWYRIFYNNRVESTCTDNFDHALILLVCAKHKMLENSDASLLIARMLGINIE